MVVFVNEYAMTRTTVSIRQRRKLPARLTPWVFAFYMSLFMALLMSCVRVAINIGFAGGYWQRVFYSYLVAMPVAFCCVMVVRPLVARLVAMTVDLPR